jgi:hypothetical protein
MTWVIKVRGDLSARIVAEYECPEHGRFTRTVDRDEHGDPPEASACPACARRATFTISAPARCRVQRVYAARRGKDPERPPNCMDWEAAAYDECSPDEWHARERKADFEAVHKMVKAAL